MPSSHPQPCPQFAKSRRPATGASPFRLAERRAIDPTAYDLYRRGRHAWSLRTDAGFAAAVSYFEQAIERDPEFALAYAGLSDVYLLPSTRPTLGAPSDARAKAMAAVTRALELDDSLAEAHTSRAGLHFFHERNLEGAEREFKKALALNPGYPTARQWYSILLAELGRDDEALSNAREAVTLDPLNGTMHQSLGLVHYYGRRYADSVSELQRAPELSVDPLFDGIRKDARFQALVERGRIVMPWAAGARVRNARREPLGTKNREELA